MGYRGYYVVGRSERPLVGPDALAGAEGAAGGGAAAGAGPGLSRGENP